MPAVNVKNSDIGANQIVLLGGLALVGFAVIYSLKGIGAGLGQGLSGIGQGIGNIGEGLGTGLKNITGVVPAASKGVGSLGHDIGGAVNVAAKKNWLNQTLTTTGHELSVVGRNIDVTKPQGVAGIATKNIVQGAQGVGHWLGNLHW